MIFLKEMLQGLRDTVVEATTSDSIEAVNQKVSGAKGPDSSEVASMLREMISNYTADSSGFNSALLGIGAGIAMVGAIGTGIGQGIAVGRGLEAIARNPELFSKLRTTLLLGLAITESSVIYCLVVAIILLFK